MTNRIYKISGMNCPSCASMLELDLEDAGVKAKCSYPKSTVEVEGDGNLVDTDISDKIKKVVEKSGYQIN